MADQTFTTGQVLTAAQQTTLQTNIGLTFILAQTIGTTVSSVAVANAFSSTFNNYHITISGGVSVADSEYTIQLGGITTGVYTSGGYFLTFGTATLNAFAPAPSTSFVAGIMSSTGYSASFDLMSPNLAKPKFFVCNDGISSNGFYQFRGICNSTVQATGFTIAATSSQMTGGTIRVYGYRNS